MQNNPRRLLLHFLKQESGEKHLGPSQTRMIIFAKIIKVTVTDMRYNALKVSKYGVFSGPYFPVFGLNTLRYFVSLRIQSKCGKTRTRKNSLFRHFSRSDILQGVSSLGVQFTRKILPSYDKQFLSQDTFFVKRGRIPLLSLNKFGEMSQATIILGKFVNKP